MPDRWSYSGRMMTSTASAASAASSAATTQRFDRHVSHATCQLTEINEHLLCALCSGYLVDATTIIECLHTFCRSCIVRYLESSETCPVCDVPLHQTNPLLGIRADTTLQTLVYKLVPGVFKDEVKRRCTVINNAHADGKSSSIMDRLLKDICDMTTGGTIYTADEQFSVCLQYAPSLASSSASSSDARYGKPCSKSSCAVSQQDLAECSYLLCPASVTVAHLKKLIRNKLELSSDLPLDLYHSSPDGSLDDVYTLADVAYITAWTSVKPLHFYYQVNAKPSQTSVKKISSVSEETDCKRKVAHGSRAEKLPGGACLKRIISNNRQNVKVKGVICSSVHKKAPKAAAKKVKSQPDNCLAVQIPKGSSSRDSSLSAETSPISGETKKLEEKSDLKDNCRRKEDCDPQDGKAAKVSFEEQNRVKSLRDFDSKEISNIQTKTSERNLIELTESEVTDTEINPKTSSRTAENDTPKQHLSPNQKKSGLADCSPSADSALSPSRPETVSQSAMTVDGFDTTSDAEGNAIDSASSPPPSKRMKMAEPTDRNLFAAINSMIVNNNDNVVSSSTSSQASADDSSDNKTSVETQTTTKLISRSSKKGKLRTKKDSVIKSRSSKPSDPDARVLPPSSAGNVVALSADTSSQSISVTAHTYSTAVDSASTQQCTSATLCVPLCISDKTGGGSNLILNLPQNVSVQCRIRSDKILIASNPTTTTAATPDVASTTFSSISYNQTMISAKSPATSIAQSQTSPSLTSQASPTLTSEATLTVKSPTQPITALSGQPKGSSITRTTVTSLAAPSMTSSVVVPSAKSTQLSDNNRIASTKDNRVASPLHRQLDTRTITENKGNVCNNSVTSVGECQTSGKEVPVKRGTVKRTVNMSDATSLKFRNKDRCHDCLGEAPLQSANRGKSETVGNATPCVSPSPVRCTIPTRSPETVLSNASALAKPQCESSVSVVAAKPTCLKSTIGQKEATATKVPCYRSATDLDVNIRDKVPQNVATTLQQNPVTSNLCMTISRPKEVVQPASTTSVVVANSVTAATSSGVSTTKAVLFKPYQITTTASHTTSPKRSADGIITATATFPNNPHHTGLYTTPPFPMFPGFQYPKDQPTLSHQGDVSKAYCCMMRDSVLASPPSCEMAKTGMSAVHRTMSNIPLHSVIKVPTYTARKMPQNKKSEKKGSRSPRNEPSSTPVASVAILKKPEPCQEALGQKAIKASEVEGKLVHPSVPDYLREIPVSKGSQSSDRNVALQATPKGIKNDVSLGKVDEGWNQLRASSSIRSCLKLPLVSADILDKGDSSSCSISTSSNEPSVLPAYESETVPKTPLTKKRFDLAGPSGNDHRHSPKRPSGKTCPTDEMSYTCAEADSGTSPGAVSLSPPRCGSKDDAPPGGLSPNSQQSPATGTSLRKKLVIDLERCSPRLSKSSPSGATYTPSPSTSLLRCCSPTTTTIPPTDAPLSGQTTPPRLVISLPRCQIPAPTTLLSPSGGCGLSQWSPTSSGTDNSPPTTKRLKLMCNGMTIYRTLESPGSRSPRRTSGGGGSRRSSPVSAPVVADCPLTLLSRASSCKSPSSPHGKSRRKSNSSTPVPSAGVEPKSVGVTSGEPVVVVSVDSTSTSPRSAATIVSLPSDNGLFTVMTPWKGHESVEEPLELTTKEVKERQKEREYAKLMTNQRPPPSAFTT